MENSPSSYVIDFLEPFGIFMRLIDRTVKNLFLYVQIFRREKEKGNWTAWLGALIISIFNAFSILYADEIFRWNLAFQIRDTDGAEPSDWEIAGRYVSWIILILVALIIYIMGLN